MAKPEYEFTHLESVPWTEVEGIAGTHEKILSRDDETGNYTRLMRFSAGADTSAAGTFTHDHWEEVYMLSGDLTDIRLGGPAFSAGMYACRPPGMPHGPWISEGGCELIEFRYFE